MFYRAWPLALVIALLSLTACSTSTGSADASSGDGTTQSAESVDASGEEIVAAPFDPVQCKKYAPTGTRVSYRICKKKSEWDQIREASQKEGNDAQRRAAHQNSTQG